jgi:copper chaperone CopZ
MKTKKYVNSKTLENMKRYRNYFLAGADKETIRQKLELSHRQYNYLVDKYKDYFYSKDVVEQESIRTLERIKKVENTAFAEYMQDRTPANLRAYLDSVKTATELKDRFGLVPKKSLDVNVNVDTKLDTLKKILDGVVVELADEDYNEQKQIE